MNRDEILDGLIAVLDGHDTAKEFICAAWLEDHQFRILTSDGFKPLVHIIMQWLSDCIETGRRISEDEAMDEIMSIFKNQKKNGKEDND